MKTTPRDYQLKVFNETKDMAYWGYFLEQGLGKSKVTIDVVFHNKEEKRVSSCLIIAPNGVHLNWELLEIPKHAWTDDYEVASWKSSMKVKEQRTFKKFLENKSGKFQFLCMNIEAIRTKRGYEIAKNFLKNKPTFMVVDESTGIKNPKAQQTKKILELSTLAVMRRILTGTPMTQGPLDLWSQCKFLHWKSIPYNSYTAFKATFAVEQQITMGPRVFNKVTGYKNLELLKVELKPFTTRLLKEDCLDLPPKVYSTATVEFHPDQERLYNQIKDEQVALLNEEEVMEGVVSATSVLTAMNKLMQICLGGVIDDNGVVHEVPNNRIKTLLQLVEDESKKYVIFSTFKHSIKSICATLGAEYGRESVVSYYGETDNDSRVRAVESFQNNDEVRFFVANRTASKGLTLTSASNVIFYGNSFSLEDRLQSEDRVHRFGQGAVCFYTDILIPQTIESYILKTLQSKQMLANSVITSDWKEILK